MFFHNYKYRLKCILRDKQVVFWTLLFPLLLATLFKMAFSNISSSENFSRIKVGIVNNDEYKSNTSFINAINSVSGNDKASGKRNLFDVKYVTYKEANKLLEENKIEGYIYFDKEIKLSVKKSGLNQTIIKSFLDDYKQTESTLLTVINKNPNAINELIKNSSIRNDYLKEVPVSKANPDTTVIFFYALIALACLYGSFSGLNEVTFIQANLSPQGARVSMVPVHKLKLFSASVLAAFTVQLAEIFILIAYLSLGLKINFGSQLLYIFLTCIVGSITGVTFGTFIASIIKSGEGLKIAVLISSTMLMSFLSGMMYDKMKYIVNTKAPILSYLNPANLITDSLYSLYYYSSHDQFFTDIGILCIFPVAFLLITYFVLRRQKYASL